MKYISDARPNLNRRKIMARTPRTPNDQRSDALNPNNNEYYLSRKIKLNNDDESDTIWDDYAEAIACGCPDGGFPDGDGGSW